MMKKALSLLLTLAMVMSMFTVGAFADTAGIASDPHSMTVSASVAEIVEGGQTTLTATAPTYTDTETCKHTVTYEWSVPSGLTGTSTSNSITLTGAAAAAEAYTVTCKAKLTATTTTTTGEGEEATTTTTTDSVDTYYQGIASVKVVADNYEVRLFKNDQQQTGAQTMKLAPNATGTVELTAQLWSKGTAASEGVDAVPAAKEQDMTLSIGSGSSYITFSNPTVTAVAAGSATIKASTTHMGKTYEAVVCNVTVGDLGISKEITNGSYQTYTGTTSLFTAIQDDLNSTMGLTGDAKLTATKVTITPATSSVFSAYVGNETTAKTAAFDLTSASTSVRIAAKAGSVRLTGEKWDYKVTADGKEYSGKLTLKSTYAATVTANQYADFAKEEFYLDSVGSSISYIRDYVSGDTNFYSSGTTLDSSIKGVRYMLVDPSSVTLTSDGKWTKQYIGYSYTGSGANAVAIAHLVNVTFTAAEYDILVSAKTGDAPFKFSDFETFTSSVNAEQNSYYAVSLAYVQFTQASVANQWELKSGNSLVATYGTAAKLNSSALSAVTVNVKQAGVYTIPFTVYFNYKTTNSSSWTTNAGGTYTGAICLYATKDGDIRYEVSYNEEVTFSASDFLSYYRSATNKTGASLTRVVFTGGQPVSGYLYTEPNRYGSTYLVANSDWFYYAVTNNTDKELGKVTYLAAATPKTEYSVYIPFSAYGNSGTVSGVVEIIVNGTLPFTDIGENHTFYKEIRYCYRNGIMNGKTDTRFDASSSVTRLQLVRTLYRMAGSPTAYNSKTIAFTDCKNLTGEAANALKWANATGMVTGYGSTFKPNSAVTRQAMVTILYRFANFYGYDTSVISTNNLAGYKDAVNVAKSMTTAMNWAVDCGFVSGNSSGKLNPGGSTTRGAAAKILAGFHDWYIA